MKPQPVPGMLTHERIAAWDEEGWSHTGDLATRDEHGALRIIGHSRDVIIRGGVNVSPREVEEALAAHPKVRDVSVVGLPDPSYGEVVCACVIPQPGQQVTLEELTGFLKPRVASFKLPTQLVSCDTFPLNSMGKVQKGLLRQQVLDSLAAGVSRRL